MRWDDFRRSDNVEDRRDAGGETGGGGFRMPIVGGGLSLGGLVVLGIVSLVFGINPLALLGLMSDGTPPGYLPDSAPRFTRVAIPPILFRRKVFAAT